MHQTALVGEFLGKPRRLQDPFRAWTMGRAARCNSCSSQLESLRTSAPRAHDYRGNAVTTGILGPKRGIAYWTAYQPPEGDTRPVDPLGFDMYAERLGNHLLPGITGRTTPPLRTGDRMPSQGHLPALGGQVAQRGRAQQTCDLSGFERSDLEEPDSRFLPSRISGRLAMSRIASPTLPSPQGDWIAILLAGWIVL
jgi:hypothetical protein